MNLTLIRLWPLTPPGWDCSTAGRFTGNSPCDVSDPLSYNTKMQRACQRHDGWHRAAALTLFPRIFMFISLSIKQPDSARGRSASPALISSCSVIGVTQGCVNLMFPYEGSGHWTEHTVRVKWGWTHVFGSIRRPQTSCMSRLSSAAWVQLRAESPSLVQLPDKHMNVKLSWSMDWLIRSGTDCGLENVLIHSHYLFKCYQHQSLSHTLFIRHFSDI